MIKKLLIFILILFTFSCKTTKDELNTSLLGVVYDYKSNPINSAKLKFTKEEFELEVSTDIDGKFLIPELDFGEYQVQITADNCSDAFTSVNHLNSQNVLIIRIHSYDDLVLKFKDSILSKDIEVAKDLIPKIESIESGDIYYNYLKSMYLIETEQYTDAESLLKEIEIKSQGEAFICLLLADLYEYHLDNKELAIKYLNKFLNKEYSELENNRLKELLNEETN